MIVGMGQDSKPKAQRYPAVLVKRYVVFRAAVAWVEFRQWPEREIADELNRRARALAAAATWSRRVRSHVPLVDREFNHNEAAIRRAQTVLDQFSTANIDPDGIWALVEFKGYKDFRILRTRLHLYHNATDRMQQLSVLVDQALEKVGPPGDWTP
jgi:hypothetical protein